MWGIRVKMRFFGNSCDFPAILNSTVCDMRIDDESTETRVRLTIAVRCNFSMELQLYAIRALSLRQSRMIWINLIREGISRMTAVCVNKRDLLHMGVLPKGAWMIIGLHVADRYYSDMGTVWYGTVRYGTVRYEFNTLYQISITLRLLTLQMF